MTTANQLEKIDANANGHVVKMSNPSMPEWFQAGGKDGFLTTIDIMSDSGYELANRAAILKDKRLIDMMGEYIKVKAFVANPYEGDDEETGEPVKGAVRIALILDDNTIAVTYSFGVRQSLALAIGRNGMRVWEPPLHFKVSSTPAKVGQKVILLPVFDKPESPLIAKGKK